MKIGYLGSGSWGFCLSSLLAKKGFKVVVWSVDPGLPKILNTTRKHPRFPDHPAPSNMRFTTDLEETLEGADLVVESVTSAGVRSVLEQIREVRELTCPFIITSKGIEQGTGLILSEVVTEVFGEEFKPLIGSISGPGYAQEVIQGLPTSVVGSGYDPKVMYQVCEAFTTETFRVYPNPDVRGVAYGGALKNIIAIACGISEGLGLGFGSRASLVTRGLHEIRKLAVAQGCQAETLNGLSGMGDLFLTCSTPMSRNYSFGNLLARGKDGQAAKEEIGMVVEGAYTCVSALELSKKLGVSMPITELVHQVVYEGMAPMDAVQVLMQRTVKEERL